MLYQLTWRLRVITWVIKQSPVCWGLDRKAGHEGLRELPGWRYSVRFVTRWCRESNAVLTLQGEDMDVLRRDSPTLQNLADLNLYPFPEMNYNCEHKHPRAFWEAPTTAISLRSEATVARRLYL